MNRFKLILLILLLAACVDPIDFDTPSEEMLGLFWTTSIAKKSIFIERKDVPHTIQQIDTLIAPFKFYTNSTNDKPIFWQ